MRRPLCEIPNCRRWTLKHACTRCHRLVCPEHQHHVYRTEGRGSREVRHTDTYCVPCAVEVGAINADVPPRDLKLVRVCA